MMEQYTVNLNVSIVERAPKWIIEWTKQSAEDCVQYDSVCATKK